jgi:putative membrane protein
MVQRRRAQVAPLPNTRRDEMIGMEWLKPAAFFGSLLYALIGVLVFWISFLIIDKLTPYDLWGEIVEKKNLALAIVVGSMCIAIGLIVAAAVQG